MSKLQCPFPDNLNPLASNGFKLTVNKLPNLTYFCQECPLPGISIESADQFTRFNRVPTPGDEIEFEPITATFLVDENMANWKAIYDWITGFGTPDSEDQYKEFMYGQNNDLSSELQKMYSDGSLIIYGNNLTPIRTIYFTNMIPTQLSGLQFTNTSSDVQYLSATVTFDYTLYSFDSPSTL